MRKVINGWYASMPPEHVDFVVRFADGYVRLARLAADAVVRNPIMDVRGLLSRDDIRIFLDSMLGTGEQPALYVVAVLTSVGWTESKEEEGKAISKLLSLDWNLVRARVDKFHRRFGIAPRWALSLHFAYTLGYPPRCRSMDYFSRPLEIVAQHFAHRSS